MKKKKINKRLLYALRISQRSKVKLYEKKLKELKSFSNGYIPKSRRMGMSNTIMLHLNKVFIKEYGYKEFIRKWKIK